MKEIGKMLANVIGIVAVVAWMFQGVLYIDRYIDRGIQRYRGLQDRVRELVDETNKHEQKIHRLELHCYGSSITRYKPIQHIED